MIVQKFFFELNAMKTLNKIKARPKTYRELKQNRLPIKISENIRHSHSISTTRGIPRLGWRLSDSMMAENLRLLEENRWTFANWKFLIPDFQIPPIKKINDRQFESGEK